MISRLQKDNSATTDQAVETDLVVAFNLIVRDSLKPIATGLSVLLVVFTVAALIFSPPTGAALLVVMNAIAAIGMFGFRVALERWPVPYRWANPVGAMLAVLVLLICLCVMRFMPESRQGINLLLLVIGAGFISLSAHWLVAVGLAMLAGSGLMFWASPSIAEWLHLSFALFCASVLSLVIHTIRVRTLERFEALRSRDQQRAIALNNAATARRESEERYHNLVERSLDAIVIHQNGKFVYANPASAKLFGLADSAQLVGAAIMDFVPVAERERVLNRMQQIISTNCATPVTEMTALRVDGQLIAVESYGIPFTYNGQPAVQTILRDITHRKHDQEAQREHERLQLIFETSPIPTIITRRSDSTVLYVNHQALQIFDTSRHEIIGRKAIDFYADANDRQAILTQLETSGDIDGYELRAKTASQRIFWILASVRSLTFDGEPALLASFIDITDKKSNHDIRERYTHMQAALVRANQSLLSTIDLDSLLIKILEASREAIPAMEKGTIMLWDETAQGLRMNSMYGYADPRVAQIFFPPHEGYVARAALRRQPLVIKDVREQTALQYHGEIAEMQAIQSAVVAPLLIQDRFLGVISLDATRAHAFTEDDLALLVTFANQAALAIDNARLHAEVRISEESYRALYEDNPSMYFTVDPDGIVLSVNRYGAEQLGYTVQELIGQPVLNVFYEEDKPGVLQKMQDCLRQRDRSHYWEFRKVCKNGTLLWVGENVRAVRRHDGKTVVLIVCEDITDRKKTEKEIRRLNEELEQRVLARTKELRESEERFRQLAENIADVFWLDTGDLRRTLYVSPAYEKIWGRSCQSLLKDPTTWRKAIHPEDHEPAFAAMNRWVKSGMHDTYSCEYRIKRPDGGWRWIFNRAFPIRNASGEVYRIAGIAKDITERKALEEQVQKYTNKLKLLVDERTERIRELEKQHIESEKLAATGRMAARIAHEINNPLGFIRTAFRLISRSIPEQDRHYRYVHTIEKEIDRIAKIVHQMLDLHRPYQESPQKFHFDETLTEILVLLKSESHERQVSFELEAERARDLITLPENMLRQIIYNIVLNAVEASPPDGVIRITAEIADQQLHVAVADQGPGISEEVGSRIFEPFFTTKSQSTTGGMGLGLSICKNLVEAMQGTITYESKPASGTVFKIAIALKNNADVANGGNHVTAR